jgi:hypothetical protein
MVITNTAFKGELTLRDGSGNDSDKSAPVRVIARSGDPIVASQIWGEMPFVHDFDGMRVPKGKIPLDNSHDPLNSIGYLNKFTAVSGDLVCSGAIVNVSDGATILTQLREGVPFEASIEWDDDYSIEVLEEGMTATVNGKTVLGPCIIYREWNLKAVAVCKFGADGDTATNLLTKKIAQRTKGLFLRSTKGNKMDNNNTVEKSEATVEVATEAKPEEVKAVEVATEVIEPTVLSQPVEAEAKIVEGDAPTLEAVEAKATEPEEVKVLAKDVAKEGKETFITIAKDPAAIKEPTTLAVAVATDPRAEAKRFILTFGEIAGVKYFADGKSYDEATTEHLKLQATQIIELNRKLKAVDRGEDAPVVFVDAEKANKANDKQQLIRIQGRESASDDRKGRK